MRKIIQVATFPEAELHYPAIVVVCNDGTVWEHVYNTLAEDEEFWTKLPDVPQD